MRTIVTVILIFASVLSIRGQQVEPTWLVEKLDLSIDSVKFQLLAFKPHPTTKDLTIWCFPYITEYDCEGECWTSDLIIALTSNENEIVAYERLENALISDAVYPIEIWIDTAPYIISKQHRAIAIRVKVSNNSRAASYSGEEFHLLVQQDSSFNELLKLNSKSVAVYGGGECQDTEVHNQQSIFIIDNQNIINDHFTLIENITYEHYFLTEDCENGNKNITKLKNTFYFKEGKYQVKGERQTAW